MNAVQKLRQLADQIKTSKNGLEIVDAWALAERLCARMPMNQGEATRVFKEKDAAGLDALVAKLENPGATAEAEPEVTEHEMNDAMRAFRKRIKMIRLDEESKLGGHGMTSGKKSGVTSIEPPREFPRRVWKALARAGRLVDEGHGFYAEPLRPPE
ncbi:MAG: hypothetical protein R3B57_04370 [Phycisphaerales bacterium]